MALFGPQIPRSALEPPRRRFGASLLELASLELLAPFFCIPSAQALELAYSPCHPFLWIPRLTDGTLPFNALQRFWGQPRRFGSSV